ncbi:hypothetical protein D3C84_614880 [compost metagenome]
MQRFGRRQFQNQELNFDRSTGLRLLWVVMIRVGQHVPHRHGIAGAFAADDVPFKLDLNRVPHLVVGEIDHTRITNGCSVPHDLIRIFILQRRNKLYFGEDILILIGIDQFIRVI